MDKVEDMDKAVRIRRGVFETNSSSSHSLTMAKGDVTPMPLMDRTLKEGVLHVAKDEFGWDWGRIYRPESKVSYLFTQLFNEDVEDGEADSITRRLREDNMQFDMLCRVIEEHTGVEVKVVPGSCGYIDHQSVGVGMEVFDNEDALKKFLFGAENYIETGNDNSRAPDLIRNDMGEDEHYYAGSYRRAEAGWVEATYNWDSLQEIEPVQKILCDEATVTRVKWKIVSTWSRFDDSNERSVTMDFLSSAGFRFSSKMKVSADEKIVDFKNRPTGWSPTEEIQVSFAMPAQTLEKINAQVKASITDEDVSKKRAAKTLRASM